MDSKIGSHGVYDGALKITSTKQTYSYTNYTSGGDTAPVMHSESLAVVKWNKFEDNLLKNIWEKSDKKLSYDLQAKIKFTEDEDDTDLQPVNHPGCYMPGLSFRVRSPKKGSFGQATYYGLSFLRGLKGIEKFSESTGSGCGNNYSYWYSESDDISDNFFNNHGSTDRAFDIEPCNKSDFTPSDWDDDPPLDGIPYIMLWQKDVSTNAAGEAVNTGGCGGGSDYSPWEWLAYTPLVDAVQVKIYHYKVPSSDENNSLEIDLFYEGENTALLQYHKDSYTAWKLKDRFGILGISTKEEVEILGSPGPKGIIIRDPSTYEDGDNTGKPVDTFDGQEVPVGFIRVPTENDEMGKASYNYKIYIKAWATVMVRVYEMEGNLDCNNDTGDDSGNERINAISAFISDPDGVSGTKVSTKDKIRKPYPRGTVKWPHNGDYFTQVVWQGLRSDSDQKPVVDPETGYTSKTLKNAENYGCVAESDAYIKLVEKGKDSEDDNVVVYTATYTTRDYFQKSTPYDVSEFGLHTLGINGDETLEALHREAAFFDDFYWQLWEGGKKGLVPGIQEQ
ncbi:MAG: hypothetical protein GY710_10440 [Desulfobacteraceae bacterium]|nr:hypothetical protein [Desulfobacteraceae bacterium]